MRIKKKMQKILTGLMLMLLPKSRALVLMRMSQCTIHLALPMMICWTGSEMVLQMFATTIERTSRRWKVLPSTIRPSIVKLGKLATIQINTLKWEAVGLNNGKKFVNGVGVPSNKQNSPKKSRANIFKKQIAASKMNDDEKTTR